MHEKNRSNFLEKNMERQSREREVSCALCQGELYPGDRYFALDGRKICEACLERYARRYFSGQLRRVCQNKGGEGA